MDDGKSAGAGAAASKAPLAEDDRVMKDVVAPPRFPLTKAQLFPGGRDLPDLKVLKDHLLKEGRVDQDLYIEVVDRAAALLAKEPNVLRLKYPVTVCGDVHGQFFDLVRLFEVGGRPEDSQYLFLGDYVDRGCFSTECVIYLFCMKLTYKEKFYMLRGNHECRQLTAFFNFKDECKYKYSEKLYDAVMRAFDNLPLAAIVNNSFFCVHGGLSPDITTIDEISELNRFREIPRDGAMCDLLWSDPFEEDGTQAAGAAQVDSDDSDDAAETTWFGYNKTRQCSYVYGVEAVKQFLEENKMTSIIRAHEAQVDGYKMQMVNQQTKIPRVITIFSAPNYCDVYKNKAACLKFDTHNVLNIKQFIEAPHPYYLPNFMDVFQWSLPFVAEKVTDMLASVLEYPGDETPAQAEAETKLRKRGGLLRKKVLAVTKYIRMMKVLRANTDAIISLKQLTPNHRVPLGLLRKGPAAIQEAIKGFESAKAADRPNEAHPESKNDSAGTKKKRRGSRRFSKTNIKIGSQTFTPKAIDIIVEESKGGAAGAKAKAGAAAAGGDAKQEPSAQTKAEQA